MTAEPLTRDDLVEILYQSNVRAGRDRAAEVLSDLLTALAALVRQEGYRRFMPTAALAVLAEPDEEE